jgi:hypothetical protein
MKKVCIAYWLLLSLLLLSRQPGGFLRGNDSVMAAILFLEPAAHFLCFLVLAVVTWVARWPIPRAWLPLVLCGYALATELLQGLVPGRRPQLVDLYQDVAGILLGCAACWLIHGVVSWPRTADEATAWQVPHRRTDP